VAEATGYLTPLLRSEGFGRESFGGCFLHVHRPNEQAINTEPESWDSATSLEIAANRLNELYVPEGARV
jgi:hypothetical protein